MLDHAPRSPVQTDGARNPQGDLKTASPRKSRTEDQAGPDVAAELNVPFLPTLADESHSVEFVERIPIGFAREHVILGLSSPEGALRVAIGGLESWDSLDTLSRYLQRRVEAVFAPPQEILKRINAAYEQRTGQTQQLIESFDGDSLLAEIRQLVPREDLLDTADRAPVIKLVNMLLFEAVTSFASDVHLQPYENTVAARMRIDGVLFDAYEIPKHLQEEVVSRIKVIGRMNVAEKRLPQDGRATVEVGDRLIDLRIATMPCSHGERAVIRLLDKSARLYTLGELGMHEATLARFQQLIHLEHGMILVTGPTGSGKSTTLYSALREINTRDRNVVTLEDPIEYQIDGISQTQINTKKGMTFASGLRSVLRQDPDIIMVGEIRDHETAVMAIQSALTGHLVFSTLHTNDAASAVTRLLDLGIEPYLISSSLVGVLAQRLVRRLCGHCCVPIVPSAEQAGQLGVQELPPGTFRTIGGCGACRQTGYRGRFAISELLTLDSEIRDQIQDRANASQILATAVEHGMRLMRDDGIAKASQGLTTLEEVSRVTVSATL